MSTLPKGPSERGAGPDLAPINKSLRRLESALAGGDVQKLVTATCSLRAALDPLRATIGPLRAAHSQAPYADPRQMRELRAQLNICTDLMNRSLRANLRAMRVLSGRVDPSVYRADGSISDHPNASVDVTT
jgi:flagellar biosynthesis/type III secretory pathway chaperone